MLVDRTNALVLLLAGLVACSTQPTPGTGTTSTTGEPGSESGSESGSETGTADLPSSATDDDGEPEPGCDCEEGDLCAADCPEGVPSVPATSPVAHNFRCVSDPACPSDDFDNPACRELVCGSAYILLIDSCGIDDPPNIDILCDWKTLTNCDMSTQDCPDGEKCVARTLDEEQLFASICVPVEGMDMVGEPCTGDGAPEFTDSCGADSMCWNGTLMDQPYDGVCLAFCESCPVGSSCEELAPWIELCVENP
jgi:hypothetical protein